MIIVKVAFLNFFLIKERFTYNKIFGGKEGKTFVIQKAPPSGEDTNQNDFIP